MEALVSTGTLFLPTGALPFLLKVEQEDHERSMMSKQVVNFRAFGGVE